MISIGDSAGQYSDADDDHASDEYQVWNLLDQLLSDLNRVFSQYSKFGPDVFGEDC